MEIICECGHKITSHEYIDGCLAWVNNRGEDVHCGCDLSPLVIEVRYYARKSYARFLKMECFANILNDEVLKVKKESDELQEQLRMCQLALKTMEQAHDELIGYTKIAVDALKSIANVRGGAVLVDNLGHVRDLPNYEGDIAIEALDKIKGKF